jgi:hypothetical protein
MSKVCKTFLSIQQFILRLERAYHISCIVEKILQGILLMYNFFPVSLLYSYFLKLSSRESEI